MSENVVGLAGNGLATSRWRKLSDAVVLAVLYYVAARLGMLLELENTQASPVWPPTGLALAAIWVLGMRVWPGIFSGAFLANVSFAYLHHRDPLIASHVQFILASPVELLKALSIAVGNTLEAVVACLLLRRWAGPGNPFTRGKSVLAFVGALAIGCLVSATVGTTTICVAGAPWPLFQSVWTTWWLGDVAGGLVLVPVIVIWTLDPPKWGDPRALVPALGVAALAGAAGGVTFLGLFEVTLFETQAYWILPLLVLVAFRYSAREALLGLLVVSALAVWGTTRGMGPFVRADQNEALLVLVGFVAMLSVTISVLAATLCERREASAGLENLAADLEDKVKARTEELATANADLIRSNRELDDFAYIASHDLREPLRGIQNIAGIVLEDYSSKLDEEGKRRLERLPVLANRLEELIDTLLKYSRVGNVDLCFGPCELQPIVSEKMDSLKERCDELGAKLTIRGPLPAVTCDAARVGEVFLNLITNALKYNESEEKLVEVGVMEMPATKRIEGGKDVHWPLFYVKDNGIGIREKHLGKIFRMFKRLHARDRYGGGTGAGMTIVKKIVERHGGRIWVESVYGEGTEFFFTLGEEAKV